MNKLGNTEAELKKALLIKKAGNSIINKLPHISFWHKANLGLFQYK